MGGILKILDICRTQLAIKGREKKKKGIALFEVFGLRSISLIHLILYVLSVFYTPTRSVKSRVDAHQRFSIDKFSRDYIFDILMCTLRWYTCVVSIYRVPYHPHSSLYPFDDSESYLLVCVYYIA